MYPDHHQRKVDEERLRQDRREEGRRFAALVDAVIPREAHPPHRNETWDARLSRYAQEDKERKEIARQEKEEFNQRHGYAP